MRKYQAMYFTARRKVEASNHIAARSLAAAFFRSHSDGFDDRYLAIVDIDEAGYGKYTGHCQGCKPTEMCSRSGTCEWCDERYIAQPNMRWPGSPAADVTDDRFDGLYGVDRDERYDFHVTNEGFETWASVAAQRACAEHWLGKPMVEHIEGAVTVKSVDAQYADLRKTAIGESTWARIQNETLDKVHEIWCRRAGDAK